MALAAIAWQPGLLGLATRAPRLQWASDRFPTPAGLAQLCNEFRKYLQFLFMGQLFERDGIEGGNRFLAPHIGDRPKIQPDSI